MLKTTDRVRQLKATNAEQFDLLYQAGDTNVAAQRLPVAIATALDIGPCHGGPWPASTILAS